MTFIDLAERSRPGGLGDPPDRRVLSSSATTSSRLLDPPRGPEYARHDLGIVGTGDQERVLTIRLAEPFVRALAKQPPPAATTSSTCDTPRSALNVDRRTALNRPKFVAKLNTLGDAGVEPPLVVAMVVRDAFERVALAGREFGVRAERAVLVMAVEGHCRPPRAARRTRRSSSQDTGENLRAAQYRRALHSGDRPYRGARPTTAITQHLL